MEKKDIASFFDNCAPWWDDDMIRNEVVISAILDKRHGHSGRCLRYRCAVSGL